MDMLLQEHLKKQEILNIATALPPTMIVKSYFLHLQITKYTYCQIFVQGNMQMAWYQPNAQTTTQILRRPFKCYYTCISLHISSFRPQHKTHNGFKRQLQKILCENCYPHRSLLPWWDKVTVCTDFAVSVVVHQHLTHRYILRFQYILKPLCLYSDLNFHCWFDNTGNIYIPGLVGSAVIVPQYKSLSVLLGSRMTRVTCPANTLLSTSYKKYRTSGYVYSPGVQ